MKPFRGGQASSWVKWVGQVWNGWAGITKRMDLTSNRWYDEKREHLRTFWKAVKRDTEETGRAVKMQAAVLGEGEVGAHRARCWGG